MTHRGWKEEGNIRVCKGKKHTLDERDEDCRHGAPQVVALEGGDEKGEPLAAGGQVPNLRGPEPRVPRRPDQHQQLAMR